MKISSFGISETGLVRQNNEDVWGSLPEDNLFVIADGMGGHLAGEVAAREAVQNLCRYVKERLIQGSTISLEKMKKILKQAVYELNAQIFILSATAEELRGMGTTLSSLYLCPKGAVIGHVGDSRIYRLRENHLEQLTQDHSLYMELQETGRLEEGMSEDPKYKNVITKAIGTDPIVEPDVKSFDIQQNDLFLLCSDGLTDLHSDQEIEQIVNSHNDLEQCAYDLIRSAMSRGGVDNITIVFARIDEL